MNGIEEDEDIAREEYYRSTEKLYTSELEFINLTEDERITKFNGQIAQVILSKTPFVETGSRSIYCNTNRPKDGSEAFLYGGHTRGKKDVFTMTIKCLRRFLQHTQKETQYDIEHNYAFYVKQPNNKKTELAHMIMVENIFGLFLLEVWGDNVRCGNHNMTAVSRTRGGYDRSFIKNSFLKLAKAGLINDIFFTDEHGDKQSLREYIKNYDYDHPVDPACHRCLYPLRRKDHRVVDGVCVHPHVFGLEDVPISKPRLDREGTHACTMCVYV